MFAWQVLGKLAAKCHTHDDRERMVGSGVPRLVVRLMGWARDHADEAVMLQVCSVPVNTSDASSFSSVQGNLRSCVEKGWGDYGRDEGGRHHPLLCPG